MAERRPTVSILQHRLLHYRTGLFDRLRQACDEAGLSLSLVHGQASPTEALRADTGTLPWATVVHNHFWRVGGKDLVWQPLPPAARSADLLVLMQENRLLSNYPVLFGPRRAGQRIAFWGHGRNFQSAAPTGLRERWKQWVANRVDWWFGYTELTRQILEQGGFSADRITVLNNAVDNRQFEADLAAVATAEVETLRRSIGAGPGVHVGLYCGSLYPDKRLDLLLQAGDRLAARTGGFRLVVIGDGPSRPLLTDQPRDWLTWVGVRRGREKAGWFRAADSYLSPGAVGLHVLEAFIAGLPMVTTATARHGPEIAFLEHGVNGLVTDATVDAYAGAVAALMDDPAQVERLRAAAGLSARTYTLEHMVENFVAGLLACLARPPQDR